MNNETLKTKILSEMKSEWAQRRARNPRYSSRAFARDLGISQSYLSQVLSGKRTLSLEQECRIAERLGVFTALGTQVNEAHFQVIEATIEHERMISHWVHFALLEWIGRSWTQFSAAKFCTRFPVSKGEVDLALDRLIRFGYVEKSGLKIRCTGLPIILDTKKSSPAIRESHIQRLKLATEELNHGSQARIENRLFEAVVVKTSKKSRSKALQFLNDFKQQFYQILKDDSGDELYQFSMQLFNLDQEK